MSTHYNTIEKETVAELKERGSRFIAHAFPIGQMEDFKKRLKELKEIHPKATHHCFAYRLGMDGTNFRVNDDGEPAGSAGRPILGQIDSKKVTNVAVVVIRYFGGTLLGVPGLIQAYKTVTSFALQLTPIVQKPVFVAYELQFDYTLLNDIMNTLKKFDATVLERDLQLFCVMKVGIPKAEQTLFLEKTKAFRSLEVKELIHKD